MKTFKASYYGFLIGDAMGVAVEFTPREVLMKKPVTDMLGYGSYNVPAGSWSDDSSMMLAQMDSISSVGMVNYEDIASKFLQWISYGQYTPTGEVFDIGRTTLKAIEKYKRGFKALDSGMEGINYNGNGSLMRMLPFAFYAKKKKMNSSEIVDLVCEASSITHRHEISLLGCYIYVRYVIYLLEGNDAITSYHKIQKLNYEDFSSETIKKYRRVLKDDIFNYPLEKISSSGYVVDTLEAVLWCICNTDSFSQAIVGAVNLGNDTDTIGALVGALAGIIYGYEEIPKKWLNKLQKKEYLELMYISFIKTLNNL